MLRWFQAGIATAVWGFLLAGAVGLAEALSQWVRFDLLAHSPPPADAVGLLLPPLVLYGWFGLLASLLAFLCVALPARLRPQPRRTAFTAGLAGGLAALAPVYLAYLMRQHVAPRWWEHGAGPWTTILPVAAWLAAALLFYRPLRRLAGFTARQRSGAMIFPLLVVIVTTSLWPDWREEGRRRRTDHLDRPAAARPAAEAPNLVLISIDTWRHDCLSRLDDASPPTPALDALADESLVYTRAWSTSPWTLPSMGTVMTGLAPRSLRVARQRPLPDGAATLAEIAWRQGYHTAAFATNGYLTEHFGFGRGFEFFEHALVLETLLPARRAVLAREASRYADVHFDSDSAEMVVPKAITWLWQRGREGPFFLWVHLLNPHLPYRWRELLPTPRGEGRPVRGTPPRRAEIPADDPHFRGGVFKGLHLIRDGEFVPDATQRRALRALYDREVQFSDQWAGMLLSELRRLGLWDRTLLVVLSDHGEEFFEHGGFEHGHSVMPEVTRVPLIVKPPAGEAEPRLVDRPVSLADLLPSLCARLGWPTPAGAAGHPLPELVPGRRPAATPLVMEDLLYPPQERGVIAWPWLRVGEEGLAEQRWYDLAADPGALAPVPPPAAAAAVAAAADSLLARWDAVAETVAPAEERSDQAVPEDVERSLRALGY